MPEIDKRTGKDWGHGNECLCPGCVRSTVSDLVEVVGVDERGEMVVNLPEERQ